MKRREALKNIGFATGFLVATPSVVRILQSCTSAKETWIPTFLTPEEGAALLKIVDILLPKSTNLPSATELNVPQFIDLYLKDVLDEENQIYFKTAFTDFISALKPNSKTLIKSVTVDTYKTYLDKYMLLKNEVDKDREANPDSLSLTKSEFLNHLKWLTINAYLTTEQIGENTLVYDPVPTEYYCGNLEELTGGTAYSL